MIIPIKTFEEMTPVEQRQHLHDLIEDTVIGPDGGDVSMEEFLREVSPAEIIKHQTKKKGYFKPPELAEKTGLHRDTIWKRFHGKPGVKEESYSGRNRKTYHTMLISEAAARKEFPDLKI